MSNGAERASGGVTYRLLRELGSRTQATYAAIRELDATQQLVVAQRFARGGSADAAARATTLDAEAMALLLRDARCLLKNWHANVARVRHVELAGPVLTIATELLDGTTLHDLLEAAKAERIDARDPLLPFPVLARILLDVLGGLHALHGLRDGLNTPIGAIHGEVCPSNIVIGKDGITRIVNVLRARPVVLGDDSEAVGYAAPEACGSPGADDPRADVHAVGAILWEAIAGRRLYPERPTPEPQSDSRARRALVAPHVHPSSPFARLADVAMRALASDPAQRFRSAAEMAAEIRKIAGAKLATGTTVAALNFELGGDRMRMRKAILEPATSGMRRRASERAIAAAVEARLETSRATTPDDAAETAPNPIVIDTDAFDFDDDADDDEGLPGPRGSSPDIDMELAMELALHENELRRQQQPPPANAPEARGVIAAETPGDFVIPIHVTESFDDARTAPRRSGGAIVLALAAFLLLVGAALFAFRVGAAARTRHEAPARAAQERTPPAPAASTLDDATTSAPKMVTPPRASAGGSPSAQPSAGAPRAAPRPPPPGAPAASAKPKKSIYDPDSL